MVWNLFLRSPKTTQHNSASDTLVKLEMLGMLLVMLGVMLVMMGVLLGRFSRQKIIEFLS